MKKNNYKTGHFAEKIALLYLIGKGYRPITMNYITGRGTGAGEIDLIMKKGKTLVFIEVKKRQNLITSAEAVTSKNKNRTTRAAEAFLQKHSNTYHDCQVRFDAVLFNHGWWPHHIKNAWIL